MKNIKIIISLILLFVSSFAFSQIVNIPDANFKARLLEGNSTNTIVRNLSGIYVNIDTNNDGEIQESEALEVGQLRIHSSNISNAQGLEAFVNLNSLNISNNNLSTLDIQFNVNLETLVCRFNQIVNLNVSNNTSLDFLDCSFNNLTNIDITQNIALTIFQANNNSLTTIDLSQNVDLDFLGLSSNQLENINIANNTALKTFGCNGNNIVSLDFSNNSLLEQVFCGENQIATLDFSNNLLLTGVFCYNNQIESLGLSNNIALRELECGYNFLTTLDVSNCINLDFLNVGRNLLTQLDISNNINLTYLDLTNNLVTEYDFRNNINITNLYIYNNTSLVSVNLKNGNNLDLSNFFIANNNPNLQFICADEEEIEYLNNYFIEEGMNVNINPYCSFTLGGNYNTVTGNITFDSQNNGCGVNDNVFPFIKININDGVETGSTFTDNSGIYNFYTLDGNFTVTPDIENPTFFNTTPIEATINFPDTNNNIEIQDFCITANGVHNDLEIVIAPTIRARPGFDAEYLITYKNKGNQTLSGDFSFTYDGSVLDYVSATEVPTNQVTGVLTWDYTDLLPFESRSVYVTLNVNSPMETPAVNIDDQLFFSATINPITGDELPNDNQFDYKQIVVGSYDPNDITCVEGDFVELTAIGEYLHYIINFENTGNADAQNIVVKTEIDETMFDVSSLRLLSSSHNADVRIKGNIVEIIFESIYLASGGHGNILLKIQTQDVLVEDDTVTKNAEIFFDYNFPIETNNANTTFALLSNPEFETDASISLYPNPVKDIMTISARNTIKNISLFDAQGRVLLSKTNASKEVKIDLSTRADGVYFIKITTDKGTNVEKIIKN